MNINDFESSELLITAVDSLSELHAVLQSTEPNIILWDSDEGVDSYFHLKFLKIRSSIGLCTSNQGQFSGFKKIGQKILVYSDQKIVVIRNNFKLSWKARVDGTIFEIFVHNGKVIVVNEIGVNCFSIDDGFKLWSIYSDLIVGHNVDGDDITLKTEGGSIHYSLKNGEPIT